MMAAAQSLHYQGESVLCTPPVITANSHSSALEELNCSCHGKVISNFLPRESQTETDELKSLKYPQR